VTESCTEGIIYRLTKDEILAGANQLGISEKQMADDIVELVAIRVGLGLRNWPEVAKSTFRESTRDPLRLVFPSCIWWEDDNAHSQARLSSN
jgi:hypothetical protein